MQAGWEGGKRDIHSIRDWASAIRLAQAVPVEFAEAGPLHGARLLELVRLLVVERPHLEGYCHPGPPAMGA
eukprot:5173664-Alexandrium_andersonii.AAC.1